MSKNFIVANIARWIRLGQSQVVEELRPHVIPITPEAIQVMEEYAATDHPVFSGPFGTFIDAISSITYDGTIRLAFRFVSLDGERAQSAIEATEKFFFGATKQPSRLDVIGEIRDMLPKLYEQGRFELGKEIMGGIHRDDFTGVTDKVVRQIWTELKNALKSE